MLKLHTSNRLETLAQSLAETLRSPLRSPLRPEAVVVQSQGMARWLKLELAERHGVCANYVFPFPKLFCAEVLAASSAEPAQRPALDREVLLWEILRLLPEMLDQPEFSPLKRYLSDPESLGAPAFLPACGAREPARIPALPGADLRKRFQLSSQIANLFDQYQVFRPDLILAWDQHAPGSANLKDNPHEAWQAALWRRLRCDKPSQHLAALWKEFGTQVARHDFNLAAIPERVSIFGISALPPAYLQTFCALGARIDVSLFLLQPSAEYWGLIVNARESERILKAVKKGDAAAQEVHLEAGNHLLASMGHLGRDFLNLVLETGDWDEQRAFPEPPEGNLLQHIQADIFHLRDRGREDCPRLAVSKADASLRVHSCHSPLREVEVLYDHLLDWFAQDARLAPRDVLVMTPDIEAYAPFIQAVFDAPEENSKRIPFSVADRGVSSASHVVHAFLSLLAVPATRLEATSILRILETDSVREKFGLAESDLDIIRVWVRQTNIRWGRDASQRESLGLPAFGENTWQQGMDRLFLGYALAGKGVKMFGDVLPFDDVEGGSAEVLGHLAQFLQRLFEMAATLKERRTLAEWEKVLLEILDDFFQPDEAQVPEVLLIRSTLRDLASQAAEARCEELVDLAVILEALDQLLAEDRFGSGFITGGVTFCALKPMRSIPFKVICLIGMDDGAFPRADRHLSFDLMAQKPRLGDRSLRADDRYLFLETLVSARERLHISYVGQSIRDNSEAPPSVLVSELLDYVAQGYELEQSDREPSPARSGHESKDAINSEVSAPHARTSCEPGTARGPAFSAPPGGDILKDHVLVRHRLQAFSPAYFTGQDARLFSYSAENCRASHCGQSSRVVPGSFLDTPLSEPEPEWRTVDVQALAEFFCNPARWLVTRRLGLRLDERDDGVEDAEPFEVGALEGYGIKQELVEMSLKAGGLNHALRLMKAAGRLPLGEAGAVHFRGLEAEAQTFLARLRPHLGDGYSNPIQIDHTLGEFRLVGEVRRLTARGSLHFRCSGIKAKDLLRLWVQHLALSAAVPKGPCSSAVLVGSDKAVEVPLLDRAPEILEEMLALYWQGLTRPLKFFPQTSLAYAEAALKRESGASKQDPESIARRSWEGDDFARTPGECEDAYFDLCFRNVDPLDEEFQQTARAVFGPLLSARVEVTA